MIKESKTEILLEDYVGKYTIDELTSEDIIKLMMKPYIAEEISIAFGITIKEFNNLKEKKGIKNVILESIKRDIETILHHIDSKSRYVSNNIRKKIVDILIEMLVIGIPKKEFYIKELSDMDFNRDRVLDDLFNNEIDIDYRERNLSETISYIEKVVDDLVDEEKNYLLNYNNQKLYNQLCEQKKSGKIFSKDDLEYDTFFELAIVENISDSSIAQLYNMSISQLKYFRKKVGVTNKYKTKMETYPEIVMYFAEKYNKRPENVSNYEYDRVMTQLIDSVYKKENSSYNDIKNICDDVTINVDGKEVIYHVNFSNEKYSVNTKTRNKKHNGARHNYKKENETKILHGKIGEQLALKAEKKRLMRMGLGELAKDVKLVAQIDEEVTLDGLGYDLISFNELRERVCIEVKTSYGTKDKPFFISKKEIELMMGIKEEYDCKQCLIYYVLIDGLNVKIKNIDPYDFSTLKLTPVLYKVE